MASAYLHRTNGTATNSQKMTFSTWFKIGTGAAQKSLFGSVTGSGPYTQVKIMQLATHNNVFRFEASSIEGNAIDLKTNRVFRDPGAWYHLVVAIDTTQVSSSDRAKIYINGVQETSFATSTYPTQNDTLDFSASGVVAQVMAYNNTEHWDGTFAHTHFIDGLQYAASIFGETDSTSGIWVGKPSPSVTYGTNGFFLKYASGAITTDSSGNGNTMTQVGTITTTKDSPDNNFCTMNPLDNYYAQYTFSNGNNTITNTGSKGFASATVSLFKGLWYWEIKPTAQPGGAYSLIGIADVPTQGTGASNYLGYTALEWAYYASDGNSRNNQASTSYGDTWTTDDIIGVYLDLDANKLYFAKNGTIQNSGTGISITAVGSTTNGFYFPATGYNDTSASVYQHNFGNGYFGTDLIASASADAGGEGQFKYNPSTGTFDGSSKDFRAICVNNIATYG
tara:strand:- start:588 stop:1937 length:1350 start_codon:yes stop_codon:yes gene_type:complete